MRRIPVFALFALSMAFGAACAGRGSGPTLCPGEGWCGPAAEAEQIAEDAAGSTLTCPIHVEPRYATDEGGGGLPQGVPGGAHGTLDEKRTGRLRADGDATTCCYTWVAPCPSA